MRDVHEEEVEYHTSSFVGLMTEEFAEIKGISQKSLFSLANILENFYRMDIYSTIINEIGYSDFLGYKESMDFVDNFFEKVNFEGKCCLLLIINNLWSEVSRGCERITIDNESASEVFGDLEDFEKLESELCFRYNLRFLEILLLMD